eukprot:jgi/Chlat1/1447/Chrsp12S02002
MRRGVKTGVSGEDNEVEDELLLMQQQFLQGREAPAANVRRVAGKSKNASPQLEEVPEVKEEEEQAMDEPPGPSIPPPAAHPVVGGIVERNPVHDPAYDMPPPAAPVATPFPQARHRRFAPFSKRVRAAPAASASAAQHERMGAVNMEQGPSTSYAVVASVAPVETSNGLQRTHFDTERDAIDRENRQRLAAMSGAEIAEAQAELAARFTPEKVAALRRRREKTHGAEAGATGHTDVAMAEANVEPSTAAETHAMVSTEKRAASPPVGSTTVHQPLDSHAVSSAAPAGVSALRFSLDGALIPPATLQALDAGVRDSVLGVKHVAERDPLRAGTDSSMTGYTLGEAVALTRSTVAGQRAMALKLLAKVLQRARESCDQPAHQPQDWCAINEYLHSVRLGLPTALRMAIDDSHASVVIAAAFAIRALLCAPDEETKLNVYEALYGGEVTIALAPVYRPQYGNAPWQLQTARFTEERDKEHSSEEPPGTGDKIRDDAVVAETDPVAGMLRMKLLERIVYILQTMRVTGAVDSLLDILIACARHSRSSAAAIVQTPSLVSTVTRNFIDADLQPVAGGGYAHLVPKAVKVIKILCQALGPSPFAQSGVLETVKRHLFLPGNFDEPGQPYPRSPRRRTAAAMRSETLRLWRVCIYQGTGITAFDDLFQAICNALPATRDWSKWEDSTLSYNVLEALANAPAHSTQDTAAWNRFVSLVGSACEWLGPGIVQSVKVCCDASDDVTYKRATIAQCFGSVMHFLASLYSNGGSHMDTWAGPSRAQVAELLMTATQAPSDQFNMVEVLTQESDKPASCHALTGLIRLFVAVNVPASALRHETSWHAGLGRSLSLLQSESEPPGPSWKALYHRQQCYLMSSICGIHTHVCGTPSDGGLFPTSTAQDSSLQVKRYMWDCAWAAATLAIPGQEPLVQTAMLSLFVPSSLAKLLPTALGAAVAAIAVPSSALAVLLVDEASDTQMVQLPDAAIAKVNAELLKVNFNEVSAALVQHYAGTWLRPQASSTSLMAEYDKSLLPLPLSWLLASPRSAPEAGATGLDVAENKPSHLTASSIMLYQLCLEGLGSRSNHVFQNVHHLHFLSELLLAFNDLFLEANTRWLLAALHDLYTLPLSLTHQGEQRDLSALVGFDRVTGPVADTFARELASHFASVSYGDWLFGRQLALYLAVDAPVSCRVAVWRALEDSQSLHLLPTASDCTGTACVYLFPFEGDKEVLQAYASALRTGALSKAMDAKSISWVLACHHVAGFVFSTGTTDAESLQRQQLLRSLLLEAPQDVLAAFFSYRVFSRLPSNCGTNCPRYMAVAHDQAYSQVDDITYRFHLAREACAHDEQLLSALQELVHMV